MLTNPTTIQSVSDACKPKLALLVAAGACTLIAAGASASITRYLPSPDADVVVPDTGDSNPFNWGSANNPGKISYVLPEDGKLTGPPGGAPSNPGDIDPDATKKGSSDSLAGPMRHMHITLGSNGMSLAAISMPPIADDFKPSSATAPTTALGSGWVAQGPGLDYSAGSGDGGLRPGPVPTPGAIVLLGVAAALGGRRRR